MRALLGKKLPAIHATWIAGFLLARYNRNKTLYILITYVFLFLAGQSLTSSASALEVSSSFYSIDTIYFAQGGGSTSSTNFINEFTLVGENIGSNVELSTTKFSLVAGQIFLFVPPERWEAKKYISDLTCLTEILGSRIQEATWSRDNDPYFYWDIEPDAQQLLIGFSVSLDNKPDKEMDTLSPSYQFADNAIYSGKHTFYVAPFISEGAPETDHELEFEIWVDAQAPAVSQLRPTPGEKIPDNSAVISANVTDELSGLDLSNTTLTVNGAVVSFTYDENTETLEYKSGEGLPEGKNTLLLKAYDWVGNSVTKGWEFIVDTQSPQGGIKLNNGEETTHSAYVLINILGEDVISGIRNIYLSNDGIFDTEMNDPHPYSPVIYNWLLPQPDTDGVKTVYAKLEDETGNISQAYSDQITLKLITPDTRIISGPESTTDKTEAHFEFESTKPSAMFSYKLDNHSQDWSEWGAINSADFTGLSDGNHYFYVKSGVDLNADNKITIDEEDATPAQWVWTVKTEEAEKAKEKILFWRR